MTTFKKSQLQDLTWLMQQSPEETNQAGLHPTFQQLQMYAQHLPSSSLSNLVDIFITLSTLDESMYGLCHLDYFKQQADLLEFVSLTIEAKYTFCCAPINRNIPFVRSMFIKIAELYSSKKPITFSWLTSKVVTGWPFIPPSNLEELKHLEAVHSVLDLYLWLSYRSVATH